MDFNQLWIGMCTDENLRQHIIRNGGKIMSSCVSQDSLLAGVESHGVYCDTIGAVRLPEYPKYATPQVEDYRWSHREGTQDISVGYCNRRFVSHISKRQALVKAAKAWAKAHRGKAVTVFVYSMHTPFMAAAAAVKKIIPDATIVLIIPDLPQYMDLNMSRLKKILKAIDWRSIRQLMKYVDKYVLYSRHMASFLGLRDGCWTVMEGSFDPASLVEEEPARDKEKITVMYSGVLDTRYGIPELLEAFASLDDRFELWFTGTGNAVELIDHKAATDSRIKNFGFLPSRRDLLLKQKAATMLISTRRPEEAASAYCFPSKLFEYMTSGNPVLSCRIDGIPEEYFNHLIAMENTSPAAMAAAISAVAAMPSSERQERGQRAREFVLAEKSNVAQAKKMLDFAGVEHA